MIRFLAVSLTVFLMSQAQSVFAQPTSITVHGKLSGGNFVNAVCSIGANGQITGTGVLYGVNPSNGYTYRYPFSISSGSTSTGKLTLKGNFANGVNYPVTLTATVPSGAMTFSYVVNGNTYTLTGTGTVTVK